MRSGCGASPGRPARPDAHAPRCASPCRAGPTPARCRSACPVGLVSSGGDGGRRGRRREPADRLPRVFALPRLLAADAAKVRRPPRRTSRMRHQAPRRDSAQGQARRECPAISHADQFERPKNCMTVRACPSQRPNPFIRQYRAWTSTWAIAGSSRCHNHLASFGDSTQG